MMLLILLFSIFFKIGLFSFGGGYAILPLIQADVVDFHKWVNVQQFTDIVAISQVTPGPISLNSATYVGYLVGNKAGIWHGVLTGTVAGLKVVVVGLILAAAMLLIDKNNFIDWKSVVIFVVSMALVLKWKMSPILLTVIAAIVGIIIY